MRIAVCNRYWATAGGGESYALAIAGGLTRLGDVDLLGPPAVDWDLLHERLRIRPDASIREVDVLDPSAVAAASRDYDLFVNVSWAASFVSLARHSVLVVHFPFRIVERETGRVRRTLVAAAAGTGMATRDGAVTYGDGFHAPEGGADPYRWTDGDAELLLWLPPRDTRVEVVFGGGRPSPTTARVLVDGAERVSATVGTEGGVVAAFDLRGRPDGLPHRVRVLSDSFHPAEVLGGGDDRRVGVAVRDVRVSSSVLGRLIRGTGVARAAQRASWLSSYDLLLANSAYTARWVRRWWGRRARVVHPAVVPRPRGAKELMILSVGRFFPPERGHSKRQLEMVRTFRGLVGRGLRGWQLHLVGGCQPEDRPYLAAVEREAEGLPVHIHLDASGDVLDDLYGRAAVYWHTAGMGEDVRTDPERVEHFGIAPLEAMSAGAVPIVPPVGGPAETVRDGTDGYHVRTFDELAERTAALARDPELLARVSQAAGRRAREYGPEAFAARLERVVARLVRP